MDILKLDIKKAKCLASSYYNGKEFEIIENDIIGYDEPSLEYNLVIKDNDGRFFSTTYTEGDTGFQEETPFEEFGDFVPFQRVYPKQKTITVYE